MYILLVEDEARLRDVTRRRLTEAGIHVDACGDGREARDFLASCRYDAAVVDIMLPGVDGLTLVRELRARGDATPVMLLTALGEVGDRVAGLDAGADDYLTKPFHFEELMARLRALLRRNAGAASNELSAGELRLDLKGRRVTLAGDPVTLSTREFDILCVLLRNKNAVLTRAQIEDNVWHSDMEIGSNIVDVYIRSLRRKLDDDGQLIQTVRGVGYALREPA